MIVGSTVSKEGALIQRLPVATKVAIGLAPAGQRNYPERLDHFIFLKRGSEKGAWVADEALMQHYAPACKHDIAETCAHCCRTIKILLLDDDVENVFPHELAWWVRSGKKCWGDGDSAFRRPDDVSPAEKWTPCRNAGCKDFENGDCAASGDLRFCLADFPILGSVCRIHTSSLRSCENIYSGLTLVQTFTGGRLAGVTVPLCVSMEQTSYVDNQNKRRPTTVPILSIRTEVTSLVNDIKTTMALWDSARSAFKGRRLLVEDDESSRAAEIPPEFPRTDAPQLPSAEHPAALASSTLPAESTAKQDSEPVEAPHVYVASGDPQVTVCVQCGRPFGAPCHLPGQIRQRTNVTTTSPEKPENPPKAPPMMYDGYVASIEQKQGRPRKDRKTGEQLPGVMYWVIMLQPENEKSSPTEIVTFSTTVRDVAADSRRQSRLVQMSCEVRQGQKEKKIVANECAFKAAPEPPPGEDTSWFEPDAE